jgi:hypothetical protein
MGGWIDDLAAALGEAPLDPGETATLLEVARDVAHRVERRLTPLSTFLLGTTVGRGLAAGEARGEALERSLAVLRSLLPEPPEEEAGSAG